MDNAIMILIALILGYGQGIKRKRKREGKDGGMMQNFKEHLTRKGRLIREQEEEIFKLKDENLKLTRKNENVQEQGCYTKGDVDDLKKALFSFMLHNHKERMEKAIQFYLYLNILLEYIADINNEKYTKYVLEQTFDNLNEILEPSFMIIKKIRNQEFVYEFEFVSNAANDFINEFNDFNYDVTFEEMKYALEFIIEHFL